MEIEPEMIVALEEVPGTPLPLLFFALPPARPMIPSAPSRRSSRRWITTRAQAHDSTSIVAPLPSPIPASSHDALRVAAAPPVPCYPQLDHGRALGDRHRSCDRPRHDEGHLTRSDLAPPQRSAAVRVRRASVREAGRRY
jgi:hypothetical protein